MIFSRIFWYDAPPPKATPGAVQFRKRQYCSLESSRGVGIIEIFEVHSGKVAEGSAIWIHLANIRSMEYLKRAEP